MGSALQSGWLHIFSEPLSAITSDFKTAYKQVTADPFNAYMFVVAMWSHLTSSVVFGAAVSQLLGSGSAPLNFSRYPAWCTWAVRVLFLLPMEQRVDDLPSVERMSTMFRCLVGISAGEFPQESAAGMFLAGRARNHNSF